VSLLVLFDVDHTLIDNGGMSKHVYADAFEEITGRQPGEPARTEGRTDRSIMTDLLGRHGFTLPPWDMVQAALERAGLANQELLRARGRVLPGVRASLNALVPLADTVVSVLTGNIRANAQVKLGTFGLDRSLDLSVGAYGEESEDRAMLVPVARARAYSQYPGLAGGPVVLVGDTPRDVQAALDAQAHVIAVATGLHSVAELRSAGAEVVLEDLRDTERFTSLIRAFAA
jgi:phosphoglycolate phosphatase-like HAD superfamily hydrolase